MQLDNVLCESLLFLKLFVCELDPSLNDFYMKNKLIINWSLI